MDVTPVVSAGSQLILGYGDIGFTISGVRHEGSVLVFPTSTQAWPVSAMADLTIASLEPLLTAEKRPNVLILGCGKGMSVVPREIRAALKVAGIVIEPMDTGAACRTYNVLLTEGRDVAAALIAV
jgi:uncharacterized protein